MRHLLYKRNASRQWYFDYLSCPSDILLFHHSIHQLQTTSRITMRSFTHILITLTSTLFTAVLANPLDQRDLAARKTCPALFPPCDQCPGTQIHEMNVPVWYPNRVMRHVSEARGPLYSPDMSCGSLSYPEKAALTSETT